MLTPEQLDRVARIPFSGCWLWLGFIDWYGYGRVNRMTAHRAFYEHFRGAIPMGLAIDHRRVRCCVNPEHLEAVTWGMNIRRGAWANKTACAHGHEFTEENTGRRNTGHRFCKTCQREANRVSYRKRVDARASSMA